MITTAKLNRACKSARRPFCAGIVKAEMPFGRDLNLVVTRFNVIDGGQVKRRKLLASHRAARKDPPSNPPTLLPAA